jgi:hypothetical protein
MTDEPNFMTAREVDRLLRWPRGRAAKAARAGTLPAITLPDGEIRFDAEELMDALRSRPAFPPSPPDRRPKARRTRSDPPAAAQTDARPGPASPRRRRRAAAGNAAPASEEGKNAC